MKRIIIGILIFALGILPLAGCGAAVSTPTSDVKQIETVLQEYYEAFNSYDLDRIGKVVSEEALEEGDILTAVLFAKGMNFKVEMGSIVSIQVDGDSALAIVEAKTSLGPGQDTWRLVREDGSWKLAGRAETQ